MLNAKNLTLLSPPKMKKRREFWPRLQKKIELCYLVSRFGLILTKFCSLSNESDFRALALSLIELWLFSLHNFGKSDFFWIFRQSDPPPPPGRVKM